MTTAPALPAEDEARRLAALEALRILDSPGEVSYDDIVLLASQICATPIGLVSFVDGERQWFKARVGLAASETARELAFCAHAIVDAAPVFVIEDASCDLRFRDNPLVLGDPHIRFYAGVPIRAHGGEPLGTVCVIDTVPRVLDAPQLQSLQALARQTTALLELRRAKLAAERHALALEALANEAEAERRRSAELLEMVLRGANLGLWDLHVPSGRFSTNERERVMLGYDAGETDPAKMRWRSLVHPDDLGAVDAAIGPHLRGEVGFYSCEHRMRHRDGRWVWVASSGTIVERDAAGAPLRIVGTHTDITERLQNRHALIGARNLLQRMGTIARIGGWELELASGKVTWTAEVYRIYEIDPSIEPELVNALDHYAPAGRPMIEAAIREAVAHGTPWDLELPFVTAKGRALTVRAQGEAVRENGAVVRLFGAFQDITERKAAEVALALNRRRLQLLTDNLPALIAHVDKDQRYTFLNTHVERVFGIDIDATLGRTMREVRGEAVYAQLVQHVEAALGGQKESFSYDDDVSGRSMRYQSHYVPDVDDHGAVQGIYSMTFDITELYESQAKLERLARIDVLTGLPNRLSFNERIEEALLRARRSRQPMAVMFMDIDRFKQINDSLGHAGGDAVLCEFARRLKACVRATDTVARLAGDEFVVLLEGLDDDRQLDALAGKIVGCIRAEFAVVDTRLAVTASMGVATSTGGADSAAQVLARADGALYEAKRLGRDRYAVAAASAQPRKVA